MYEDNRGASCSANDVQITVAIPAYQDYVTRTKVSEGMAIVAAAKTAVAETYTSLGHFGATGNGAAGDNSFGLPQDLLISGTYVAEIEVTGGTGLITITYSTNIGGKPTADGKTIILSPITTTGSVRWTCNTASATMPLRHRPSNCR